MADPLQNIRGVLESPSTPLWFPDLAASLTEQGWQELHRQTAITPSTYGTSRVLTGKGEAPHHIAATLPVYSDGEDATSSMMIELLSEDDRCKYQRMGLAFYSQAELAASTIFDCLRDAISILAYVPTLQKTVGSLAQVCHILKPEDDDSDVSHSDPCIPFSIFVSVPQRRRMNDGLRVVEAIVHEAMHLQLTLIEQALPLIRPSNHTYFSPWKGEHRSPQGILHALYVFRVVDQFLEQLLALAIWTSASIDHMRNRRIEVAKQIREIETFADCPALTESGAYFVRRLLPNQTI